MRNKIVNVIYFVLMILLTYTIFLSCDAFITANTYPFDNTEYYYTFVLLIFIGISYYITNKYIDK